MKTSVYIFLSSILLQNFVPRVEKKNRQGWIWGKRTFLDPFSFSWAQQDVVLGGTWYVCMYSNPLHAEISFLEHFRGRSHWPKSAFGRSIDRSMDRPLAVCTELGTKMQQEKHISSVINLPQPAFYLPKLSPTQRTDPPQEMLHRHTTYVYIHAREGKEKNITRMEIEWERKKERKWSSATFGKQLSSARARAVRKDAPIFPFEYE